MQVNLIKFEEFLKIVILILFHLAECVFFYKRHVQHGKSLPHSALALHALSGSGFAKKAGGDRSLGFREARFEKLENEKLHFEAGSFVLELLSF